MYKIVSLQPFASLGRKKNLVALEGGKNELHLKYQHTQTFS